MPRKGPAEKRKLSPDPVYRALLVTQIVNKVMLHGKRTVAEKIVYDAMKIVEEKTGSEPVATLKRAVDNIKPPLEVKSRRVGGATYQVPMEVRLARRLQPRPSREDDGRVPRRRGDGRRQRPRRGDQASRRHAEDGRVEPRLRPLPLVVQARRRGERWHAC